MKDIDTWKIWENYKGTQKEREDADTNKDGKLSDDEKEEVNKEREKEGKQHLCAKEVNHESFGFGKCVTAEHAAPDENGYVSWYRVMFEHGPEIISTDQLHIILSETHDNH